jgi:predicted nucleic acid-binding protein
VLIVDAGPLYAAAAAKDRNHAKCVELLSTAARPLLVPSLVVTEVAYLLADRLGPTAEIAFASSIAHGELLIQPVAAADWDRVLSLVTQYQDQPLGIVDASVVALAERLKATSIATLDRRHFAAVRPRHVDAFTLVPD